VAQASIALTASGLLILLRKGLGIAQIAAAASSIAFFTSVSRLAFTAATAFERDNSLIAPVRVP